MGKKPQPKFRHTLIILTLLFAVSVFLRWDTVTHGPVSTRSNGLRFWNNEVVTHFGGILNAWRQLPVSRHWFLPIAPVSRHEDALDRTVYLLDEEASRKDRLAYLQDTDGNTTYVSFLSGGFIMIHALFWLFRVVPGAVSLGVTNLILQYLTVIGLAGLVFWAIRPYAKRSTAWVAAAAASCYIFALEALHSHVTAIWAHQVLQPLIPAALLVYFVMRRSRLRIGLLATLAFICPLVEWAGFLLVGGLFGVALFDQLVFRPKKRRWSEVIALAGGGLAAIALFLSVYQARIGLVKYFSWLLPRIQERDLLGFSEIRGNVWGMYFESFGPYLVAFVLLSLVLALLVFRNRTAVRRFRQADHDRRIIAVILVLVLVLVENLLMLSHVAVYAFDRLKWLLLMALVLGLVVSWLVRLKPRLGVVVSLLVLAVAAAVSVTWHQDLFGNHLVHGNVRLFDSAPLAGPRRVAAVIERQSPPSDLAIVTMPSVELSLYLGEQPLSAQTIQGARGLLRTTGWKTAKLFVLGGINFDYPGGCASTGDVTAIVGMTAGSDRLDIALRRAKLPYGVNPAENEFPFHNQQVAKLFRPGLEFKTERGDTRHLVRRGDLGLVLDAPTDSSTLKISLVPDSEQLGALLIDDDILSGYAREVIKSSGSHQSSAQ